MCFIISFLNFITIRDNLFMKIETTIIEGFDTVKFFRKVKEKISKEIYGMSDEQLKEYFKNNTKEKFFEKYNEQKSKKEIIKHI